MKAGNVQAQASRATQARQSADKATQRREPGGGSYKSQFKAKQKLGAAVPRNRQMPEELKGEQVRQRA